MALTFLETEKRDTTGIIWFNAPPANGLNLDLVEEFAQVVAGFREEQRTIRCLILASRLEGVFIAGADIKMIKRYMEGSNLVGDMVHFNTRLQKAINQVEDLPFPVISAINGHAMGGGLELALACDFRFMAKGKARVGLPEVNLGLLPGAGGTQRLSRLIGKSIAKDIIYNRRFLDAEDALTMGMIDRAYEPEVLLDECLAYAEKFKDQAGVAISVVKGCINKGLELPLADGLALEMRGLETLLNTTDAREGVGAFLEKRKPLFTGR
ncbi:MAG: enoyl-CoA hydratase/isomerase family protein [Deltaproteobacteria bacterium]|nr:enoyl-CoA hydratase/isomerase family protein [Deltaproteobacteria bacterium]